MRGWATPQLLHYNITASWNQRECNNALWDRGNKGQRAPLLQQHYRTIAPNRSIVATDSHRSPQIFWIGCRRFFIHELFSRGMTE